MENQLEGVEEQLKEAVREVVITNLASLVGGLIENKNEGSIRSVRIITSSVFETFKATSDRELKAKLLESGAMVDAASARESLSLLVTQGQLGQEMSRYLTPLEKSIES